MKNFTSFPIISQAPYIQGTQSTLLALMEDTDLIDIWRVQHPDKSRFTWHCNNPNIFCRLDFFLVSFDMTSYIKHTDIKPGFRTDHSKINLTLATESNERGKGFWKLNCSLLSDKEYIDQIKATITDIVSLNTDANPGLLWDTVKSQIRERE